MTQNIQWTKPVCQLDADHLYIGQTTADLDIMARDGSYLIPAGLRKTVAYESLCATVAGKRQAIEKQIEAAQNLDELNVINNDTIQP